jgi:hypothetical protein
MRLLFFKYPRTIEENRTLKVSLFCIALLEFAIIFSSIKQKNFYFVKGILISAIINIFFIFLMFFIRLYEFYICFSADYILYVVKEEDTLLKLSDEFLPECNPWITMDVIKKKNLLERDVICGDMILVPTRR